ncbi:MAG: VOC family protein [Tepidisphaeraceae bacterium]
MVLGIHHIQLTVPPDKLDATRRFYINRLGFEPIANPFNIEGFWLAAGGQQVHIRVEENVDRYKTRAHAAFVIDNLAAVHVGLVADGCVIEPQKPFDHFERLHVIDPGGNRIELMQRIAAAESA